MSLSEDNITTDLNFSPKYDMCVSRVRKSKNTSKLLQSELTDLTDVQFGRLQGVLVMSKSKRINFVNHLRSHFKFDNLNLICNYWRFVPLVKGCLKHSSGIAKEFFRKPRPFESEAVRDAIRSDSPI